MKTSEPKPTKEKIFEMFANLGMVQFNLNQFKSTHPCLMGVIMMAMGEYAAIYHKEKLREDLIDYEIFHKNDPDDAEGWVNDYLKHKE